MYLPRYYLCFKKRNQLIYRFERVNSCINMNNLSAVLYGPNVLKLENRPIPDINENEVLIKMDSIGICGSDVKSFITGKCGAVINEKPLVTGHEGAGVVIKIGSQVTNLNVGDRVAIEPTNPCRSCEFCKKGRYNLCDAPNYASAYPTDGNLCRYFKHIADFCHKIPDTMTMEEGAAVQPLAIAVHACNRAGLKLGDKLLITGAGPIGVMCLTVARAMGVSTIVITDVLESRLGFAKQIGADQTLLVSQDEPVESTVSRVLELFTCQPDKAIDCCGFESSMSLAMLTTKKGGVITIVGIGKSMASVPITPTLMREVDIRGSMRFTNTYPTAIDMVARGVINLKQMVTHHFMLEETHQAFEVAKCGEGIKIIIHAQPRNTNNIIPF